MVEFQEGIQIDRASRSGANLSVKKNISCFGKFPDALNFDAIVKAFSNAVRLQVARLFENECDFNYLANMRMPGAVVLDSNPGLDFTYRKVIELGTSAGGDLRNGDERLQISGKVDGKFEVFKARGGNMPTERGAIIAESQAAILQIVEEATTKQLSKDLCDYLINQSPS